MRSNQKKVLGAVAVAGLVAATGSAFTASGLSESVSDDEQFIGGTVTQTLTGAATLSGVSYGFSDDGTNRLVDTVDLTFSAITAGSDVDVSLDGGASWDCAAVANSNDLQWACTGTAVALSSLAVTVSEAPTV